MTVDTLRGYRYDMTENKICHCKSKGCNCGDSGCTGSSGCNCGHPDCTCNA